MRGKLLGTDERLVIVTDDGGMNVVDRESGAEVYEAFDAWTQTKGSAVDAWEAVEAAAVAYIDDAGVSDVTRETIQPLATTPQPQPTTTATESSETTQSSTRVSGQVHAKDADCTIDPETGLCAVCGVADGEPCPECGGRSFHLDGCSEVYSAEEIALANELLARGACLACGRIGRHSAGCSERHHNPIKTVPLADVCPHRFAVVNLATDDQPQGFETIEDARAAAVAIMEQGNQYEIWDGDTLAEYNR